MILQTNTVMILIGMISIKNRNKIQNAQKQFFDDKMNKNKNKNDIGITSNFVFNSSQSQSQIP